MTRLSPLRRAVLIATAGLTVVLLAAAAPFDASAKAAPPPSKYYVDCSQKRSGTGAKSAPWNTLNAVNMHAEFGPRDQILLKRGTTCKGQLTPKGSGAKGAPIVLGAYGTSRTLPTIAGGGTAIGTGAIQIVNEQYWTVQDIHVTNKGSAKETAAYRAGVLLLNHGIGRLAGLKVQRMRIDAVVSNLSFAKGDAREFGGIAAITNGTASSGYNGLQILNNKIDRVGRTGIVVSNHTYPKSADIGVRISGNTVSWSRGDSIVVRGSRNARIDHNVSANGAALWPCKQCGKISPYTANAGIWAASSNRVRIDHNEVYGEHDLGGDGEGFDIDASAVNVVLEYNYAHDNAGGGVLFAGSNNATARFNILQNNGKSAFVFIGSMPTKKRTSIYNNTVYNSSRSRARIVRYFNGTRSAPIVFKNNILYNYARGFSAYGWPTKKVSTAANTLIGLHGAGRPKDSITSWRDPALKNPGSGRIGIRSLKGYKPRYPSTSQRGVAIPKDVRVDFFGKKINSKRPPRGAAG